MTTACSEVGKWMCVKKKKQEQKKKLHQKEERGKGTVLSYRAHAVFKYVAPQNHTTIPYHTIPGSWL